MIKRWSIQIHGYCYCYRRVGQMAQMADSLISTTAHGRHDTAWRKGKIFRYRKCSVAAANGRLQLMRRRVAVIDDTAQ